MFDSDWAQNNAKRSSRPRSCLDWLPSSTLPSRSLYLPASVAWPPASQRSIGRWLWSCWCFLAALVEARNDGRAPLVLLDLTIGFTTLDSGPHTTPDTTTNEWLSDIRPAQNCYEQNVEITKVGDKVKEPVTTSLPFCEYHGNQHPDVGPLRFQVLKDITIGSELLAWPDLLLGLSIGLPFLTIQHIKSPTCYCCTECGLSFAQPNILKSHLFLATCGASGQRVNTNTQTGTLQYTCTFCGRRYPRRYSLVIHQRTHTGHKPLVCRVCARRFGDPSNLNKHLRTHGVGIGSSENNGVRNPYVCKTCGNVSARRRDFERHIKRKHGVEES
ncbi:PR domain zinc finger protein 13 [Taenia crassiceps]|uniref:PR domain zinc finger protein 13 n=1 Tax=Taenia crassiceps TaxID=6207 RepID=A0ABR4Q5S8_9CEST